MKYLCLIYNDENAWERMPAETRGEFMGEFRSFTDDIKKSGHYKGGDALQPTTTATTVRVRNGAISTTDGPYAETKEALTGFYLLECADLDEAVALAAKIPGAWDGAVEVRPTITF